MALPRATTWQYGGQSIVLVEWDPSTGRYSYLGTSEFLALPADTKIIRIRGLLSNIWRRRVAKPVAEDERHFTIRAAQHLLKMAQDEKRTGGKGS